MWCDLLYSNHSNHLINLAMPSNLMRMRKGRGLEENVKA